MTLVRPHPAHQTHQTDAVQVLASQSIAEELPFAIPSLGLKGDVRPVFGNRLHVVTIALGEAPIETEVRRFLLVTTGGNYEPIGAGGGADLIIPLDRLPIDREIGEILPSDAIVALTRRSSTSVMIEAGPRATLTFLYELPLKSSVRSLRLPDGRELTFAP
jgi:hypothetical protein